MSSTSHPVPPRGHFVSILMLLVVLIAVLLISSCGRPKQPRVNVPPPPPPESTTGTPAPSQPAPKTTKPAESATPPKPTEEADLAEPVIPAGTKPIETQTGLASWYGPPYHNRRGSNGEIYNMNALTAAHRTLPLGSRVRIDAGSYSGEYIVTDTGGAVKGHRIDIWRPTTRDAMRFGRRAVKLTVLELGGKRRNTARIRPRTVSVSPAPATAKPQKN